MEIKGREVMKVVALVGEHSYDVEKDTPMHGKKYRRFAYLGKAFIANVEDKFCKLVDDETLYSVDLMENEEGKISIGGYTSINQEKNMATIEDELATIAAPKVNSVLTPEILAKLASMGSVE